MTARIGIGVALVWLLGGCTEAPTPTPTPTLQPSADYVGTTTCAECHTDIAAAHAASHHALAMQTASPSGVVATLPTDAQGGIYRADDDFWFREGAERYRVTHTFGVYPLQQYLVDTTGGRKQALTLAWDDRPIEAGGQRFFELYPHDSPTGEIEWSSRGMTWNAMCADCHSTAVSKGFVDGEYTTTTIEETVGCEACHGPGSMHRDNPATPLAVGPDVCLPCHSRRTQLKEQFRPGLDVFDYYQPVAIAPPLYHADGQIESEVYVWGSFHQSRMSTAGVTCLDCHDVHQAGAVSPSAATCLSCHSPSGNARFTSLRQKNYLGVDHYQITGHEALDCLDCHMPTKLYMGVDERHDHSFRIPDPALASAIGSLDPCGACHSDSAAAMDRLLARDRDADVAARPSRFATLAAGHGGSYGALPGLVEIASDSTAPLLNRTQAIRLLSGYDHPQALDIARTALGDAHPLIRIAGIESLDRLPEPRRWGAIKRLLDDPVRAVRFAAVDRAATYLNRPIEQRETALIQRVIDDYRRMLERDADQPEAHVALASLDLQLGRPEHARAALERALEIEPQWIAALINLSIIDEQQGDVAAAGEALAAAASVEPPHAAAFYARGLFAVRNGDRSQAIEWLSRANEIEPNNLQFGYAAALARAAADDITGAIDGLAQLRSRFGDHATVLTALATHLRDAARFEEALEIADVLVAEHGPAYARLAEELRMAASRADG